MGYSVRARNHSLNPGEAGANPALSRNREFGPEGLDKPERLADCGSDTVRGRRWSPTGPQPAGPTLHPGLIEGHLVNLTIPGRSAALVICFLTAILAAVALAAPAQGAAYRYWSYWQGESGTWVAAQTGAGDYTVVDQDVQGWRFGITSDAPAKTPDNDPQFATLCPQLAQDGATEGQVRVAVVIDSGFTADAPEGQTPPEDAVSCVTVPQGSTGNQALAAAGSITDSNGIVCAIDSYPADECGPEIPDAQAQAAAEAAESEEPNPAVIAAGATDDTVGQTDASTDTSSSTWVGLLIGAVVVIGLIAAAIIIPKRRRADAEH